MALNEFKLSPRKEDVVGLENVRNVASYSKDEVDKGFVSKVENDNYFTNEYKNQIDSNTSARHTHDGVVYTTKNKPKASDVGLDNVLNVASYSKDEMDTKVNEITSEVDTIKDKEMFTYENELTKIAKEQANLFDEELELGTIGGDGTLVDNNNCLRSKNYISVLPNKEISINENWDCYFYDGDKNFISVYGDSKKTTIPSNCYYIKFKLSLEYGVINNHDIMLNYGEILPYQPYKGKVIHESELVKYIEYYINDALGGEY